LRMARPGAVAARATHLMGAVTGRIRAPALAAGCKIGERKALAQRRLCRAFVLLACVYVASALRTPDFRDGRHARGSETEAVSPLGGRCRIPARECHHHRARPARTALLLSHARALGRTPRLSRCNWRQLARDAVCDRLDCRGSWRFARIVRPCAPGFVE